MNLEIVKICLGSGGLLGIIFLIFKLGRFIQNFDSFKSDTKNSFKEIKDEIKEVRRDVVEIRERLAFVEAETIIYNTIPHENNRSKSAKKMWERRKAKQVAKLEKK